MVLGWLRRGGEMEGWMEDVKGAEWVRWMWGWGKREEGRGE